MDSNDSTSKVRARTMPFVAVLQHDLRVLGSSWLVRLWLAATALLAMIQVLANWDRFQTAPLIATLLFPYLIFPWSLVVMTLSVVPLSGAQADVVADSFLSRPVTRHAFLLATWAARVILVLGVFLLVMIPAMLVVSLAERPTPADAVTVYGAGASLTVVGLVLTCLVSVGFLLGVTLRNTWLAVVVLVFLWFPVNLLLNTFSLEEFSPITLTQALPTLLREPWTEAEASEPEADFEAAFQDAVRALSSLGGSPVPQPREQGFFAREDFSDFSLTRVLLGYGVPMILSITAATICFSMRDL
jgi:hypothetical protein